MKIFYYCSSSKSNRNNRNRKIKCQWSNRKKMDVNDSPSLEKLTFYSRHFIFSPVFENVVLIVLLWGFQSTELFVNKSNDLLIHILQWGCAGTYFVHKGDKMWQIYQSGAVLGSFWQRGRTTLLVLSRIKEKWQFRVWKSTFWVANRDWVCLDKIF